MPPSTIPASGTVYTLAGNEAPSMPSALETAELLSLIEDYADMVSFERALSELPILWNGFVRMRRLMMHPRVYILAAERGIQGFSGNRSLSRQVR